jgi:tRNA A37 threonylcarbamoyladenosine biosynthesis protein TsaE
VLVVSLRSQTNPFPRQGEASTVATDAHLYAFLERVSEQAESTIVVDGDSGSGKSELCKRAIEFLVNRHAILYRPGETVAAPPFVSRRQVRSRVDPR